MTPPWHTWVLYIWFWPAPNAMICFGDAFGMPLTLGVLQTRLFFLVGVPEKSGFIYKTHYVIIVPDETWIRSYKWPQIYYSFFECISLFTKAIFDKKKRVYIFEQMCQLVAMWLGSSEKLIGLELSAGTTNLHVYPISLAWHVISGQKRLI